jgi:hypothetical protein
MTTNTRVSPLDDWATRPLSATRPSSKGIHVVRFDLRALTGVDSLPDHPPTWTTVAGLASAAQLLLDQATLVLTQLSATGDGDAERTAARLAHVTGSAGTDLRLVVRAATDHAGLPGTTTVWTIIREYAAELEDEPAVTVVYADTEQTAADASNELVLSTWPDDTISGDPASSATLILVGDITPLISRDTHVTVVRTAGR